MVEREFVGLSFEVDCFLCEVIIFVNNSNPERIKMMRNQSLKKTDYLFQQKTFLGLYTNLK